MNGFCKCVFGELRVNSLNLNKLKNLNGKIHYLKKDVQEETLIPNSMKDTSIIDPNNFNIHEIKGVKQSGFLDFMIPDYPTNNCTSFETISENEK